VRLRRASTTALALTALVTATLAAAPAVPLLPNPWLEYGGVMNSAHRGGAFEVPENTLFAFRESMLRGADQLETDVAITADGEVVVIHDTTVDRTTDGSGRVADLTLAEVQALDAGFCFEPGGYRDCKRPLAGDRYPYRGVRTGEVAPPRGYTAEWFRIPTLREVLEVFPGVPLNVEIKATGDRQVDQRAAELVAEVLGEFERTDDVIVVSFDDGIVAGFKANAPEVHTAPGLGQGAAWVAASQGPGVGIPEFAGLHRVLQLPPSFAVLEVVTEDLVRDAHAANLAVHVFTIDDAPTMVELTRRGVDSIMTNRVELLEQTLGGLAYRTPDELLPACPAPEEGCNAEAYPPGTFGR
jgi:glycerophosphoryl diester phosphodiesterase